MAITPPAQRIWWKEPIEKVELIWVVIAFLWGLFMFFFMIAWHFIGGQNLSTETYRIAPWVYQDKVSAFAEKYQAGEEAGVPLVRPPAGEDVYLLARLWDWWPILELKKGEKYRLHLTAMDYNHGFSLQPINMNVQLVPGFEHVLTITPNQSGQISIVCNEFCGIGHHTMVGRMYIKD